MEKAKFEDFKAVQDLFEQDAGNTLTKAYLDNFIPQRLFMDYEKMNELMLRLNLHKKQLVVARVLFINQRQGNCERLIALLGGYGRANGYESIIFESVHSDAMRNFLVKHGFELTEGYGGISFDWVKPLD